MLVCVLLDYPKVKSQEYSVFQFPALSLQNKHSHHSRNNMVYLKKKNHNRPVLVLMLIDTSFSVSNSDTLNAKMFPNTFQLCLLFTSPVWPRVSGEKVMFCV